MSYDQDLSFVYFGPTKVIFGNGSSTSEVESEMRALGCSRAVVVTDHGIIAAGLLDKITRALGEKCVGVFSDVPQDTGVDVVDSGAAFAREKRADSIISLGVAALLIPPNAYVSCLPKADRLPILRGFSFFRGCKRLISPFPPPPVPAAK